MVNIDKREDLVNESMALLRSLLGRGAALGKLKKRLNPGGPDAAYRLTLPDRREVEFLVSAWPTLRPSLLATVEAEIERWAREQDCGTILVASSYVSESLAAKLRKRRIWFADSAGNAYVEVPGVLFVYSVGKKPAAVRAAKAQWMSERGAKVLYELLACGPLVEATYRDIEESTGVSLGMISKLVSEWVKDGILERRGRGTYEIVHGARLLDMWVRAYADTLQPKVTLGRYRAAGRSSFAVMIAAAEEEMDLDHITVGGEYAADLLTGAQRAQSLRLYVPEEERGRVQRAFQLAPSPEGSVEMCEAFAGDIGRATPEMEPRLAHPVLVVAELLASDETRLGKVAAEIRRKHLPWVR
ncbi:MAG: type IV toxin-antitoxin system AbiEi family antitoxin [Candidatus Bipolaricaulota bacterium]|nr:type IV toxin-antitoxin system AbiEi family antitoxin [Candidatus Bipolaricaulota bacterium]